MIVFIGEMLPCSFSSIYVTFMVISSFSCGTLHLHTCPVGNLWHRRALEMCPEVNWYHCLFDTFIVKTTTGKFVEKCLEPKEYLGKRYVFSGNMNALDCTESRYTPGPIWSYNTRDSECPVLKTLCNEEGLVVAENGSTKMDRSCRCNYRLGYKYVKKPKDPCRCFPLKEDCSCYVHQCPRSTQVLSQDYECIEKEILQLFTCDTILDQRDNLPTVANEDTNKVNSPTVEIKLFTLNNNTAAWTIVCCGITLTTIFIGIILCVDQFCRIRDPTITIDKPMAVYRGSCIHLSVRMNRLLHIRRVYWSRWNAKAEKWSKINYESGQKYEGTVDIFPSLCINEVTASDSGSYQCQIQFDDFTGSTCSTYLMVPEEMFISKMPVVGHYLRTKQLQEIKDAFNRNSGQNLVILQGLHGSGKTQAGHKYCTDVKDEFSVVAKIYLTKNLTFKETLETLAAEMNLQLTYQHEVTTFVIINAIKEYLNHKDRFGSPYILFVDNVDYDTLQSYEDINMLVSLLYHVSTLKIILATTDQKVLENLSNNRVNYQLIKFQGMDKDEIYNLFGDVRTSKDEIDKLVTVIGTIPLVLVSAIRFILTSKISVNEYCEKFGENSNFLFQGKDDVDDTTAMGNNKSVLQSQLIPLTFIRKHLEEIEWEVVVLMPFLDYNSISATVLESCYFHLTQCSPQESTSAIKRIIETFTNVSMGQIESFSSPLITVPGETVLYFHKITMKALDVMCENDNENKKGKRLLFLLKMFCSEIDSYALSYKTVSRNLLFVNHANKLLDIIQKGLDDGLALGEQQQVKFYMAFTQCAIGSTWLFEGTEVEKAHKHLIKARTTALDIIEEKSIFSAVNCVYIQDLDNVPTTDSKIAEKHYRDNAIKKTFQIEFPEDFVNDFVVSKRGNRYDMDAIQLNEKRTLPHYLSRDEYQNLCSKQFALPWKTMSHILMPELMLQILHNNGRAFDELSYIVKYDDKGTAYRLLNKHV